MQINDRVRIRKGFGTKGLTGTIVGKDGRRFIVETDQVAFARNVWKLTEKQLERV
jgi:hypothetical protein